MSNTMIRELSTTEIDMVSGAFGFSGGYAINGTKSFTSTNTFDGYTFEFGGEVNIFEGLGGSIAGLFGGLLGALFG